MTLSVTDSTGNPQVPGISAQDFLPDQLIAGGYPVVTRTVTIASGAGVVKRGTVLGQITSGGKYTTALSASSDGSQTITAICGDTVDATSADQRVFVYVSGEFNFNALTQGTGIDVTTAANLAALRALNIYIKGAVETAEVVVAADPS